MNTKSLVLVGVAIGALSMAGCNKTSTSANPDQAAAATIKGKKSVQRIIGNRGDVMMAIQHLDRPAKDKENDEIRKAAAVLQFTGVRPGMTVVELEAGSGYYTDILSRIVGESGSVVMQNPAAFDQFLKPEVMEARLKPLGNVRLTKSNFDAIDAPDESADIVTWMLGPHELFYTPKDSGPLGEPGKAYAEIFRVLKPGGSFIALDHASKTGAPESVGGDLHRIDPATVQARAEKAGFVLSKKSKIFYNPDDDHTKNVFDPEIRRKTDRFLHKYTKPK